MFGPDNHSYTTHSSRIIAQFPSIAQLQKEWLISLWNTEPQDNVGCLKHFHCVDIPTILQNAEGPQMLFRPTQLCSTMQIW